MQNWTAWLAAEKHRWDPFSNSVPSLPKMRIPIPFDYVAAFVTSNDLDQEVQDSALQDLDDSLEFVTHNSGIHGKFDKSQRIDLVRNLLSDTHATQENGPIVENTACIYKYIFPYPHDNEALKEQIGVGLIKHIQGDAECPDALFDIQFCPPSGALPQSSKRPDTLYQDIDAAMKFNLHHKITKGPKGRKIRVPDIEKNQPRSALLAYNLELTKMESFLVQELPVEGTVRHLCRWLMLLFQNIIITPRIQSSK
jgi:hypothetical protein